MDSRHFGNDNQAPNMFKLQAFLTASRRDKPPPEAREHVRTDGQTRRKQNAFGPMMGLCIITFVSHSHELFLPFLHEYPRQIVRQSESVTQMSPISALLLLFIFLSEIKFS